MEKEIVYPFIWSQYQDIMKQFVFSHCDKWFARNKVKYHMEDGQLKGLILFHDLEQNGVEIEAFFVDDSENKGIFFRLFREAIRGKQYIVAACQKANAKMIKFLTCIQHEVIGEDDFNIRFLLKRNYIRGG